MLRKSFIALLLLLVSSVAVADGTVRQGVVGQGVAVNSEGREGAFTIRAVKVTTEQGTRIEGNFRFSTGNRDTRTLLVVEARVERLRVNEHDAGFAGRGVMVIKRGTEVRRVEGIVEGRCADNRRPNSTDNKPDAIGFSFTPRNTNADGFRFGGNVRVGDLHVFTQTRE
jgi:hypothetical protein